MSVVALSWARTKRTKVPLVHKFFHPIQYITQLTAKVFERASDFTVIQTSNQGICVSQDLLSVQADVDQTNKVSLLVKAFDAVNHHRVTGQFGDIHVDLLLDYRECIMILWVTGSIAPFVCFRYTG
ncbi:MAG: hypothetical protein BGP07_02020 [Rhizobiales bacterium 63-22]|nr:MAG: hypothetical protein BGP07_02020 [Rhizobiales bacterium 63-22]